MLVMPAEGAAGLSHMYAEFDTKMYSASIFKPASRTKCWPTIPGIELELALGFAMYPWWVHT